MNAANTDSRYSRRVVAGTGRPCPVRRRRGRAGRRRRRRRAGRTRSTSMSLPSCRCAGASGIWSAIASHTSAKFQPVRSRRPSLAHSRTAAATTGRALLPGRALDQPVVGGERRVDLAHRVPHRLDPPRRAGRAPMPRASARTRHPRSRCRTRGRRSPSRIALIWSSVGDAPALSPDGSRPSQRSARAIDFGLPIIPTHQIGTRGFCTVLPIVGNSVGSIVIVLARVAERLPVPQPSDDVEGLIEQLGAHPPVALLAELVEPGVDRAETRPTG